MYINVKQNRESDLFIKTKFPMNNYFKIDIQELSITVSSTRSTEEISLKEDKSKRYFNSRVGKTFGDQQKWKFYSYVEVSNKESLEEDDSLKSYLCGDDMPLIRAACFVSRQVDLIFIQIKFSLIKKI